MGLKKVKTFALYLRQLANLIVAVGPHCGLWLSRFGSVLPSGLDVGLR
jgi:hypothetical protein